MSLDSPFGRYLRRWEAEALGYTVEHVRPSGEVRSMTTGTGYLMVYGAPSYMNAVREADKLPRNAGSNQ